mmetsp:Transcript_56400/g.97101  ORF Transcript_56400/g.97101 Transcript_56400/m.97101 type:complete len:199 (+) Transcript_56400:45-641(+)
MAALADEGDVGDANELHFGSVTSTGDGYDVQFLFHHEVVSLLETISSEREADGDNTDRLRQALEFNKGRANCDELGPERLRSFCESSRAKLQSMVDRYGDYGEEGEQRLHPYEIAALLNLIDTDEAEDVSDPASMLENCRTVIPSLIRFADDFLVKEVLATLKREREELRLGGIGGFGGEEDDAEEGGEDAAMGSEYE